jgi:exosome complex component RRP45
MKINQLLLSTNEVSFILDAIKHDLRIDGRKQFDFRKLSISFGKQNGQALILLGSTK